MLKIRLIHHLMIASTVALLFAVSAMADNMDESRPATYASPAQGAGTTQTLGTLRRSEMESPPGQVDRNMDRVPEVAPAQPMADATHPVHMGDVIYVTGGIGDEERDALHAVEKDYNLRILSAEKNGQFTGDDHIIIRDHQGVTLVDADAGPIFYAHLPPGAYVVEASSDGQTKKQRVTIGAHSSASLRFGWP